MMCIGVVLLEFILIGFAELLNLNCFPPEKLCSSVLIIIPILLDAIDVVALGYISSMVKYRKNTVLYLIVWGLEGES